MFKKVAWIFLKVMIFSVIIAIAFDFYTIILFYEDMRTQIYIAGHYVETMSADPEALASGEVDSSKLYKDEDIKKEFGKFVNASYYDMSKGDISGDKGSYTVNMGGVKRLNRILARANVVDKGGIKGVNVTLTYVLQPYTAVFFEEQENINGFQLRMQRDFRIVGG